MRRKHFDLLAALVCIFCLFAIAPYSANAASTSPNTAAKYVLTVTEENTPDDKLRAYLIECSSDKKGNYTNNRLEDITFLNIDGLGIENLTGIELFPYLETIGCANNNLTSLDNLPDTIQYLDCPNNKITSIENLPPGLISLNCSQNQISQLPALPSTLEELTCSNNLLTELPALPLKLYWVDCSHNQLTKMPKPKRFLSDLYCSFNQLETLPDLSGCNLHRFDCSNNKLSALPMLGSGVADINCSNNQLENILDLSYCTNLAELDCSNNKLTNVLIGPEAYSHFNINVDQNYLSSKDDIIWEKELTWGDWERGHSFYGTQKTDSCHFTETVIQETSCNEYGKKQATCTDCGITCIRLIPKVEHEAFVYPEYKQATFDAKGTFAGLQCKTCGEVLEEAVTIPRAKAPKLSYTKIAYNGALRIPEIKIPNAAARYLKEGTEYELIYLTDMKNVGLHKIQINLKGDYTGSKTVTVSIVPKKPASATAKLRTISGGYDDVRFEWTKSVGATGYLVYYKKSSADKYTFYKSTTGTYVTKNNLTDGTKYTFKVIPYYKTKTGTTKYYSTAQYKTATITTLKKLNQPKVAKSGTKVKVTWNNIAGETGYEISRSTKKTGTNIVKTVKTTSGKYTTVSATKGTTYYYKVRAYKLVGKTKVFGPWSTVKAYKR